MNGWTYHRTYHIQSYSELEYHVLCLGTAVHCFSICFFFSSPLFPRNCININTVNGVGRTFSHVWIVSMWLEGSPGMDALSGWSFSAARHAEPNGKSCQLQTFFLMICVFTLGYWNRRGKTQLSYDVKSRFFLILPVPLNTPSLFWVWLDQVVCPGPNKLRKTHLLQAEPMVVSYWEHRT